MYQDRFFELMLMGILWGLICGVGPLIYGIKHKKEALGIISLIACGMAGAIFGVFLAVPLALIMFAIMTSIDPKA